MKIYGYHRVSGQGQHLDRGIFQITQYCDEHGLRLEKIYCDKATGKNFDRAEYVRLKRRVKKEILLSLLRWIGLDGTEMKSCGN
nr:recombinase family protein [Eubacterium sp. ER2]